MDGGVVIFDGNSRLTLTCIGDPELGYPVAAYRTRIEIKSGPFSVCVEAFGRNYATFVEALKSLHDTMTGEVRLEFWNESHSIVFTGSGKGDIGLTIEIRDCTPFGGRLTVPMHLNQSYLPDIITGISSNFPAR